MTKHLPIQCGSSFGNGGFTLLEILLVSAMVGILGLTVGPILSNAILSTNLISSRGDALAEARNGMERMVAEIRLIPSTSVLANIAATNLQFQYPAGTAITYMLSGTNLLRNSDILMDNVTSLTFSYFDATGTVTATASNVRSIGIKFSILSSAANSTYTLQTQVFLRNTGNNYANFTSP